MQKFVFELLSFIKNPQASYLLEISSVKNNRLIIYNAIAFYFLTGFLLYLPVNGINKFIDYFFSVDLFKLRDKNMKISIIGVNALLIVALIAPIVEETLFRLWLVWNKTNLSISSILIFWVVINRINHYNIYTEKINENFYHNILFALAIAAILFFVLNTNYFKHLFSKNFKWFYWGSSIAFGLVHILNFSPIQYNIIWAYPFFVLPQLLLGFILGFIRLKSGFYWALLTHCVVNLPGAVQLFFKH